MSKTLVAKDGVQADLLNEVNAANYRSNNTSFQSLTDISITEIQKIYAHSSIIQRAINKPAHSALKNWRAWQLEKDQISLIEKEEKRHNLKHNLLKVIKMQRLYGGGALLLDIKGQSELYGEPLDFSKINAGDLLAVTPIAKANITCDDLAWEVDALSGDIYTPEYFKITIGGKFLRVHKSRLCIFNGVIAQEINAEQSWQWGHSALEGIRTSYHRYDNTSLNISDLIFHAKTDIMLIEGYNQILATNDDKEVQALLRGINEAVSNRNVNSTLIGDATTQYLQKTANFSNLDNILASFRTELCASCGIPESILFMKSNSGLNNSSQSDIDIYIDTIKEMQSLEIEPQIRNLDMALKASAGVDLEGWYEWLPIQEKSAKERAEIGDVIAKTAKTLKEADLIPYEALSEATANQLIENSVFAGLEQSLEEHANTEGNEEELEETEAIDFYSMPKLVVDNDPLKDIAEELERIANG